jgi:hypothetical protein
MYPSDWTKIDGNLPVSIDEKASTAVIFFSSPDNRAVVSVGFRYETSLKEVVDDTINALESQHGAHLIKSSSTTLAGLAANRLLFMLSWNGMTSEFDTIITTKEGKSYIIFLATLPEYSLVWRFRL